VLSIHFKRALILSVSLFMLALTTAPFAFAGEDDGDDEVRPAVTHASSGGGGGGGGSDTGSASGGVQTGFGGSAVSANDSIFPAMSLAGGGLVVLTAAGLLVRRRDAVTSEL
jgi:hypothetical protein